VNGCHGNKNKTFYILNAFHNKRMQTSIIHIALCSHEIIDNENPDFFAIYFLKMRNEAVWLLW
jgi:hypothetical protein